MKPQNELSSAAVSRISGWRTSDLSGTGWLDAEQEIRALKPDIWIANEDGDKGGKREFCQELGIEYRVLRCPPAPALPKRSSTDLRGF